MTMELKESIMEKERTDDLAISVFSRLENCADLVAEEAIYHVDCYSKFVSPDKQHEHKGRPLHKGKMAAFTKLCEWLERDGDCELHTMKELMEKVQEFAEKDDKFYSDKSVRRKLKEKYNNHIFFTDIPGQESVIGFKDMVSLSCLKRKNRKKKPKNQSSYLRELLPPSNSSYNLRTNKIHNTPTTRTERFQFSFFPYCISKWNQLNPELQNSVSLQSFKRSLLLFIRPTASPIYTIHHARGLKLLTRSRLGLSHLREHKFRHNFNDTINPFCSCGTNSIESAEHFLLHCPNFPIYRCSLFDSLRQKDSSYLVKILLFGNDKFKIITNEQILTSVIDFIIQSKRFDGPLF